jgi:acyl carrier protein
VIQYFPGVDYLVDVLGKAVAAVRPGGAVFVGDIRNRDLMEAFHASVELHRAPASLSTEELRRRVRDRRDSESELLVSPAFFSALQQTIPEIGHVSIQLKRGQRSNEMTRFRYDALLRVGERLAPAAAVSGQDGWTLPLIHEYLDSNPPSAVFEGIENPRLARELRTLDYLHAESGPATVGELKDHLAAVVESGIHPEALFGMDIPYDVELSWSASYPGRFDAVFRRRGLPRLVSTPAPRIASEPWERFVNRQNGRHAEASILCEIREHVRVRRPEFMVPSTFVVLDSMPRTPNGKVDWKALPAPRRTRTESAAVSTPPQTEMERLIAAVWGALLNLDSVGRNDNFFDLGANSLLMVQAHSRLREQLGCALSLVDLFHYPTVSGLAARLSVPDSESPELQDSQKRGRARLDAALRRMHAREVASVEKGA